MSTTIGLTFKENAVEEFEKFQCPHCEKNYATQEKLDKHVKEKHIDKEV